MSHEQKVAAFLSGSDRALASIGFEKDAAVSRNLALALTGLLGASGLYGLATSEQGRRGEDVARALTGGVMGATMAPATYARQGASHGSDVGRELGYTFSDKFQLDSPSMPLLFELGGGAIGGARGLAHGLITGPMESIDAARRRDAGHPALALQKNLDALRSRE